MTYRTLAILCAALTLSAPLPAAALSWPFGKEEPATEAPLRPVVTEITVDTPTNQRSVPGVVVAASEVQMAFQALGRMVERPVDIGDRVNKGDLLARLDPEDVEGTVRSAEAAVVAAEVNLSTAQNTAERARALAERNVASTAQLEQAEQALAAAQSTLDESRAQLESARDAEGFTVMTAPITGVISAVNATPGAIVSAGDPIMTLSSEDKIEARIDLTETQLRAIEPGTPLLIRREQNGDGSDTIEGKVNRIAPVADAQTRTRRVYITLPDDTGLRLGSLIRVHRANSNQTNLTVPAGSIVKTDSGNAVWIVNRQGDSATVHLQPIQPGEASGGRVVVSKGLSEGDEVVIRGVNSLTEGQAVGRRVNP